MMTETSVRDCPVCDCFDGTQVNVGDVVCVDRKLIGCKIYTHYGVYVGQGMVVHFAGKEGHETDAGEALIQKVSVAGFLDGGKLMVDTKVPHRYSGEEIAQRALSYVGKQRGEYNLVFHNCEHFASWCASGKARSRQVEDVAKGVATVALATIAIGAGMMAKSLADKENDKA